MACRIPPLRKLSVVTVLVPEEGSFESSLRKNQVRHHLTTEGIPEELQVLLRTDSNSVVMIRPYSSVLPFHLFACRSLPSVARESLQYKSVID